MPGNLNVSFDRIEAESLILAMKRFSLSSGSACSSGERGTVDGAARPSASSDAAAMGSIRFGLGKSNTADHIEMLIDDLKRAVRILFVRCCFKDVDAGDVQSISGTPPVPGIQNRENNPMQR